MAASNLAQKVISNFGEIAMGAIGSIAEARNSQMIFEEEKKDSMNNG